MFTFGADPELMLMDGTKLKSSIGVVRGDKENRYRASIGEFYYDNVLAEFAVKPSASREEAIENIRLCLKEYSQHVYPYKLIPQAAAYFPIEELRSKTARTIGCTPERCVYTLEEIEINSSNFANMNLRTAGGHIHIGTPVIDSGIAVIYLVRMFDLFLGIPSVFVDKDKSSRKRKEIYGKAGRYRLPNHGLEYRSLGNFWLNSPKHLNLIYDLCEFAINFVGEKKYLEYWSIDYEKLNDPDFWNDPDVDATVIHNCHGYNVDKLRSAIDEMNKEKASEFLPLLEKQLYKPIFEGIMTLSNEIFEPEKFYRNWGI